MNRTVEGFASTLIEEVQAHLLANAHRYYPNLAPDGIVVQPPSFQQVKTHTWSYLLPFKVTSDNVVQSLVVKVVRQETAFCWLKTFELPPFDLRGKLEYDALTHIGHVFSESKDVFAFKVLDYIPACDAVVMEESKGVTLHTLYRHYLPRLASKRLHCRLVTLFHRAGFWLSRFHWVNPNQVSFETAHLGELLESVHAALESLGNIKGNSYNPARIEWLLKPLSRLCASGPIQMPVVWLHDDYHPKNIFVDSQLRVAGFDTFMHRRGPAQADLAQLSVSIRTSRWLWATGGILAQESLLQGLENAFLEGYAKNCPQPLALIVSPVYLVFKLKRLITAWAITIWACQRRLPDGLSELLEKFIIDPFFERNIHRLLNSPWLNHR